MKQWSEILKNLALLTQFGLTLLTPTLMCVLLCYLAVQFLGWGEWIYILGFFFGLGGSADVAWKLYKRTMKNEGKSEKKKNTISFNDHM